MQQHIVDPHLSLIIQLTIVMCFAFVDGGVFQSFLPNQESHFLYEVALLPSTLWRHPVPQIPVHPSETWKLDLLS